MLYHESNARKLKERYRSFCEFLRYDLDCSELCEVMVEGERHCYPELFHNHFTGAIREAPSPYRQIAETSPRRVTNLPQ
jgi:hypothetical protein